MTLGMVNQKTNLRAVSVSFVLRNFPWRQEHTRSARLNPRISSC